MRRKEKKEPMKTGFQTGKRGRVSLDLLPCPGPTESSGGANSSLAGAFRLRGRVPGRRSAPSATDEQGYTLVTVLLLFLVVSLVAMSLLEITVSSYSNVAVQENLLRARQNAENGALAAMAKLEEEIAELNGQLRNAGARPDVNTIQNLLNEIYRDRIAAETPEYKVSIDEGTREVLALDPSGGLFSEKVEIVTEGRSAQFKQTYRKSLLLTTVPDLFHYALLSQGDVTLNGAPYIEGDLFAKGDVNTTNQSTVDRAYDLLSIPLIISSKEVRTSYPAMLGNLSAEGRVNGIPYEDLSAGQISPFFSLPPSLKEDRPAAEKIPVGERVNQIKSVYDPISKEIDRMLGKGGLISIRIDLLSPDPVILNYPNQGDIFFLGDLDMRGDERFAPMGNVYVRGYARLNGNVELSPGHYIYVNGSNTIKSIDLFNNLQDLLSIADVYAKVLGIEISLGNIVEGLTALLDELLGEERYAAEFSNLTLSGTDGGGEGGRTGAIYVNGNAAIHQSIHANTSIYVKGFTDISQLSTGTNRDEVNDNTLLLLSEGKIRLVNERVLENDPISVDAFLYSNDTIQIDGNLSNLILNGGIYGNEITLNALKGKVQLTPFASSHPETFYGQLGLLDKLKELPLLGPIFKLLNGIIRIRMDTLYIEDQSSLDYTQSRLTIRYKKEMILHPPGGIPTVNKVSCTEIEGRFE